jgi:hypothetical protein
MIETYNFTKMNSNRFNQLRSQYQIVAVDDYDQKPSRIYIAKSTNEETELTEVIAIDFYQLAVYEPQKAGSYAKFMCPIRKILPEKDNVDEIWQEIENLPETIKNEIIKLTKTKNEQMENLNFKNAYYIKLGEKGSWAKDSIEKGIVRIGWSKVNLNDLLNDDWNIIENTIKQDFLERGKMTGATQDYKALKRFCNATVNDVFITFYEKRMYWCNLKDSFIEKDFISKYRKTIDGWHCTPINNSEKILYSNEISGKISKTEAFRATLCHYKTEEIEIINRIINGIPNPKVELIQTKKKEIVELIKAILTDLHWKDCEILTDLIFQQSGWHRISMSGGSMEFIDFEYIEPINKDRYIVQVKSGAKKSDFIDYQNRFIHQGFRKLYFVSFNPDKSLIGYKSEKENIEIICEDSLATMIFDLGLLEWVLKKSF